MDAKEIQTVDVLVLDEGEIKTYYPQTKAARNFFRGYGAEPDGGYPFMVAVPSIDQDLTAAGLICASKVPA